MPGPDPTVRGQELGERLRLLREQAGLSLRDAARRIDVSPTKLSRLETGHRTAAPEDATALLAVYGVTGATRREVLALAREADKHGWWQRDRPDFPERQRTLISLEARADYIVNYENAVIPGLLQTGEYTRAIMTESGLLTAEQVEQRMVTRLHRHAVLRRRNAPTLVAVVDEHVLRRVIGSHDVLRRQLEYLVEATAQPNIRVHVLPNTGAHAGINGSFSLLHQREGGPTVAFVENLTCSLFVEDASDVATYKLAVQVLLTRALDATQSREVIASLATAMDAETDSAWSPPT